MVEVLVRTLYIAEGRVVLKMPVMVGYTQDLVRACSKSLGCINGGGAAYVVRLRRNNNGASDPISNAQ